ncbi:uncharacterized protein LOC144821595 isoform X2 [Lissotriton helveticus]
MTQPAPAQERTKGFHPKTVEMLAEQYDDFLSVLPLDLLQENVVLHEIQKNNPDAKKALPENPYPCRMCTKSFRHFVSLQCHRRTHTAYKEENWEETENFAERATVFACTLCDLVFKNKLKLQSHQEVHKEGVRFRCKECEKTFDQFKLLELHRILHKDQMPLLCTNSTRSAVNATETSAQIQSKENKNISFICTECGEYFISSKEFLKHQKSHTAFKPVGDLDSEESGTLGAQHSINSEPQKTNPSLACTWCGAVFVQKGDLQAHLETHIGDSNCSQTELLMSHHQGVPKGEGHQETLQGCGQLCIQTEPLVSDQSLHVGLKHQEESCTLTKVEPIFSCNHCNKIFGNKVDLLTHQTIHTDHKPFACEECGNGFIQEGYLLSHQRIIHDEKIKKKLHICYECGKILTRNINLQNHLKMHLRDRLNVCTEQGKKDTPYNSIDCDQSGTVTMEPQTHQEKHVKKQIFTCSPCGRKFTRKRFRTHQKACTGAISEQCSIEVENRQELLKKGHFSCRGCRKKFPYKERFLKHRKAYLRNGLYMCTEQKTEAKSFTHKESDESSTDKMDIGQHHEKHEEEQLCECTGCGQTFTYRESFLKHQKSNFREGLYLCAKNRMENGSVTEIECDPRFTDLGEKTEEQDPNNCTCMGCGTRFTGQKSFQTHKAAYLRKGLYLCAKNRKENEYLIDSECDQRITDLEKPQEKQEQNNCTCLGCGRKFTYQKSYVKHLKFYFREGLYLCTKNIMENEPLIDNEGDQKFADFEELAKGRKCKCRGCGKKFIYRKSFLKHLKVYLRKGLYLCAEFKTEDESVTHKASDQSSTDKMDIGEHHENHEEEANLGEGLNLCAQNRKENEPLIDSECDQRVTNLKKPQKMQEKQKCLSCRGCGRKFINQKEFQKHQKSHLRKSVYLCSKNRVENKPLIDCDLGQSVANLEPQQEKQDEQNCTCLGCGSKFTDQKSYLEHQKFYFREGLYLCIENIMENEPLIDNEGGQKFTDFEKLAEGQNCTCRGCGRKFTYHTSFIKHLKAYLRKGLYLCAESKTEGESVTHKASDQSSTDKMDIGEHHENHEEEANLGEDLYLCAQNRKENEPLIDSECDQRVTDLEKPQKMQEKQKCLSCRGCGRKFINQKKFQKHQKSHLRNSVYLCSKNRVENQPLIDSDLGQSVANLETQQEKQDEQNCTCLGCGSKFTDQKSFLKHRKAYLRKGLYLCAESKTEDKSFTHKESDQSSTDKMDIGEHHENHEEEANLGEGLYLCPQNRKENEPLVDSDLGQSVANLKTQQENQDEKNCTCRGCGRKFTYHKSYLKHQTFYFREGLYLCTKNIMENEPLIDNEGDQKFTDFEKLAEGQNCTCRGCGRKFTYHTSFIKHLKSYVRYGIYVCTKV